MKIGIDIGGSHIASGIVLTGGRLQGIVSRDIHITEDMEQKEVVKIMMGIIKEEIDKLLSEFNYKVEDIKKIGVAVPGNPIDGKLKNMVNLNIKEFDLSKELKKLYNNVEVEMKNDGKAAGLAEKEYGALKGYDDSVFLCIGTGIGSAVFLNGKLLVPKNSVGFEMGHVIIQKDGKECNCKNKGCFEAYGSMKEFKAQAIELFKLPVGIDSEKIQSYIRENIDKKETQKFIDEYLDYVTTGLIGIINTFEPEIICFGGSFSYYSDIFLPILEKKIKEKRFNKDNETKLVPAELLNNAGILGSVL